MTTPATNPDLPPSEQPKPSLLAQTYQAIGQSTFKLGRGANEPDPRTELNRVMWSAAANLTMGEYACCRRLKADWLSGVRRG